MIANKTTIDGEETEENEDQKEVGSDEEAEIEGEAKETLEHETIDNEGDDDAMTVATSAIVDGTNISLPTAYFNKRAEEFQEQLKAEKLRRMQLEN